MIALWEQHQEVGVIHVRGTPISGRLTLACLLQSHVRKSQPDMQVAIPGPTAIFEWTKECLCGGTSQCSVLFHYGQVRPRPRWIAFPVHYSAAKTFRGLAPQDELRFCITTSSRNLMDNYLALRKRIIFLKVRSMPVLKIL